MVKQPETLHCVPLHAQGTVTVFNLDPDTTNEHLVWLFSKFGDVKVGDGSVQAKCPHLPGLPHFRPL